MTHRLFCTVAALALFTCSAIAAPAKEGATLKPGDPAPKLEVSKWVKGGPVDSFEKGKIYVIECWATWCGPCIASIPHVTKLQAKFKDKGVTVIGMNVWERDLDKVEPFVKEKGDKMGYAVAMDVPVEGDPGHAGKTAQSWLKAAGQNGIPCSFIVDRAGRIAWIGHPMTMERVLGLVADDKFDLEAETKFQEKKGALDQEFSTAMRAKDWDKALTTMDQLVVVDPSSKNMLDQTRLRILMDKKDYAAANTLAARLAEDLKDEEMSAIRIAYTLVNAAEPDKVDGALALKLAEQAVAKADPKAKWQYQSVLAKAYAMNKQYDKAVATQEEVVKSATGPMKDREEKALEEYKAKLEKK